MSKSLGSDFKSETSTVKEADAPLGAVRGLERTINKRIEEWPAYSLLIAYVAIALFVRAPGYLFSELNWDEALYRLMADSLLRGHAPYTEFWDRKPVGVFVVFAVVQGIFGSDILALRLVTSVGVGVSAFLLALLARRLFPTSPGTGVLAGALYILYSMHNGGEGTNTELVFTPLYLAGAVIVFNAAACHRRGLVLPSFLAGLLVGAAVQVKYIVVFDIMAFAAIYLVTQLRDFRWTEIRRLGIVALATGIGIVLPTAVVFLWYLSIGRVADFFLSNIIANEALLGETAPAFSIQGLIDGLRQYDILVLGAAAAVLLGPFLGDTSEHKRNWFAIVAWLLAMSLSLLFLRRFADHFFIQTLPALSVATAWAAMRIKQVMPLGRTAARFGLIVGTVLVAIWAGRSDFDTAFETIAKRGMDGITHWGDRTATIAAALRDRLGPSDSVYVLGRTLGVYAATARPPPTRFPFPEHLWSSYAPLNGVQEVQRILEGSPAFIIIDDLWLPNGSAPAPARDRVTAILHAAIASNYVLDGKVTKFVSWGGGFVGGGIGVTVFRRREIAPFEPTASLQYTQGP